MLGVKCTGDTTGATSGPRAPEVLAGGVAQCTVRAVGWEELELPHRGSCRRGPLPPLETPRLLHTHLKTRAALCKTGFLANLLESNLY